MNNTTEIIEASDIVSVCVSIPKDTPQEMIELIRGNALELIGDFKLIYDTKMNPIISTSIALINMKRATEKINFVANLRRGMRK